MLQVLDTSEQFKKRFLGQVHLVSWSRPDAMPTGYASCFIAETALSGDDIGPVHDSVVV